MLWMCAHTASTGSLVWVAFFRIVCRFLPNKWPSSLKASYEHLQANFLLGAKLPPTRGEWFKVEAGRRDDCNTKEQRNMGGRRN